MLCNCLKSFDYTLNLSGEAKRYSFALLHLKDLNTMQLFNELYTHIMLHFLF